MARHSDVIESMAIAGAMVCLAHCVALPLVVAALPALATIVPVPAVVHVTLLGVAVPTTMLALAAGWRHHRLVAPPVLGAAGLALLAIGVLRYGETPLEAPVTIAGSLALAAAHLINWRLRRPRAIA